VHRPQPAVRRPPRTDAIRIGAFGEVNGDPGGVTTLDDESFEPTRPPTHAVPG